MIGFTDFDEASDSSPYAEVDPTGRYGRYNEILGKGSSKIVYRAFDEYEGIEVAWNQVKLTEFLQRPEDLERLYSEIHLLKTLKHKNIMKFYASWVDTNKRNINFVTEMFTSGTLRQYRLKHRRVNIRAVKHWCRQILEGLLYLHTHDPPVIHRDLKCDNILINGNQGEVKIGDLGLAAILRKSHAAHCVGTPEFMAPEVYAEEYNELVDIYSFGMCVLEMVTFEYPYTECTHPAQIYKKVTSGKKPDALYKVNDPELRIFVEKCLARVSDRLSARELLEDPFLHCDDYECEGRSIKQEKDDDQMNPTHLEYQADGCLISSCYNYAGHEAYNEYPYQTLELAGCEMELFTSLEDDKLPNKDISITGKRRPNGDIFLRLRITDKEGRVRNIYFPFDTESDTALSVATEMVAELDINDHDVSRIAEMIDGEIASLAPEWKGRINVEEADDCKSVNNENDYVSNGTLADYLSLDNPDFCNPQILRCPSSSSIRGRFEEVTYQDNATENQGLKSTVLDVWTHHERRPSWVFHGFDDACQRQDQLTQLNNEINGKIPSVDNPRSEVYGKEPPTPCNSPASSIVDHQEFENEEKKEPKWLNAKVTPLFSDSTDYSLLKRDKSISLSLNERGLDQADLKNALKKLFSSHLPSDFGQRNCTGMITQKFQA